MNWLAADISMVVQPVQLPMRRLCGRAGGRSGRARYVWSHSILHLLRFSSFLYGYLIRRVRVSRPEVVADSVTAARYVGSNSILHPVSFRPTYYGSVGNNVKTASSEPLSYFQRTNLVWIAHNKRHKVKYWPHGVPLINLTFHSFRFFNNEEQTLFELDTASIRNWKSPRMVSCTNASAWYHNLLQATLLF